MKYKEIIAEKFEMVAGYKVLINPNVAVLHNFINSTHYKEVRGLWNEESNEFFFWDARGFIHDSMANRLGLTPLKYDRLTIQIGKPIVASHQNFIINIWDDSEMFKTAYYQRLKKYSIPIMKDSRLLALKF